MFLYYYVLPLGKIDFLIEHLFNVMVIYENILNDTIPEFLLSLNHIKLFDMKNAMKLFLLLLLFPFLSKSQSCPDLPLTLPNTLSELEAANYKIARCYAPDVRHLVEKTPEHEFALGGRSDLITSVFYDGDENGQNNWENVENFSIDSDAFDPVVYYSVIWTDKAWMITYGFYHPRDYAPDGGLCCNGTPWPNGDSHEHDFEAVILIVNRVLGDEQFEVVGGYSNSHGDFLEYLNITSVPIAYIDNRTHAIELNLGPYGTISGVNPCDDSQYFTNYVSYALASEGDEPYVTTTENSSNFLGGEGKYILLDIFGSDPNSLISHKDNEYMFDSNNTDIFSSVSYGCPSNGGDASAPWGFGAMQYTTSQIEEYICESLYPSTNCPNIVVEYNPYHSGCGDYFNAVIESDLNWTYPDLYIINEMVVKSGATLTIDDRTLKFTSNGRIVVERGGNLIISDSRLDGCGDEWEGIIVQEGNGENPNTMSGVVEIIDGTDISEAKIGLRVGSNEFNNGSYDVLVQNTHFQNNEIGIQFNNGSAYGSKIIDCAFIQNYITGIQLNDLHGISIKENFFKDIPLGLDDFRPAIMSSDSYCSITQNNYFDQGIFTGVSSNGTYPYASLLNYGDVNSVHNHMNYVVFGLFCAGSTSYITNNEFYYSQYNTLLFGENKFIINGNTFEGSEVGVWGKDVGGEFNFINCNLFHKKHIPVKLENSFAKTRFLENSFTEGYPFSPSGPDIRLINSDLSVDIGTYQFPAGNCFSSHKPNIIVENPTTNFNYFYNNGVPSCNSTPSEAIGMTNIFTESADRICEMAGIVRSRSEGEGKAIWSDQYRPGLDTSEVCFKCLVEDFKHLVEKRKFILSNQNLDKKAVVQKEVDELDFYLIDIADFFVFVSSETGDYSIAETLLMLLDNWKYKKKLFGVYMLQGKYTNAKELLSEMQSINKDGDYFKEVQRINLIRLTSKENYSFSKQDLNKLKKIALSSFPSKGYAAALLYRITGKNVMFDAFKNSDGTYSNSNESKNKYEIYPNPSSMEIKIKTEFPEKLIVNMFSITGELIHSVKYTSDESIDISKLVSGIYVVELINEDLGRKEVKRFIKQ